MERIVVTLDGPAGVGKSTMAKGLSESLGIPYLDTGAMFRAVAWTLGQGAWEWEEPRLAEALEKIRFDLHGSGADSGLSLAGRALGQEIRTEEVGMWASHMAKLPVVRDMGSVVFPAAEMKFFLDADPEERARRRCEQLRAMGQEADLEELTASIRARDEQDRNRAVAPLRPAPDAVVVDTTRLSEAEVAATLLKAVQDRLDRK
jgi:cytidylate kinase